MSTKKPVNQFPVRIAPFIALIYSTMLQVSRKHTNAICIDSYLMLLKENLDKGYGSKLFACQHKLTLASGSHFNDLIPHQP